ncbi:UvrD-helicase domain-containing protein [Candidatus Marimicrobium litorale]|uniref:DNA 3'-5' helicase n=1 Tax=Candidatus Marimicrobium litorale TaxID=2518991 RepID=A0ABT3T4C8_9GAMM|nr:UvrD-helicase domain-containing protein [Candidatus Marimicrobium litorale]MCX2976367.1 DNA helicase UvrD [Candidatus Marimicrobium litorale]
MKREQTVEELLDQLISHWCDWESYEAFYLETLAPQLTKSPESGDDIERSILESLKGILTNNEWLDLPDLIREKLEGTLRDTEQKKIRQEAERKAEEEKKKRKEQERLLAEQREKKERIEKERKRLENAKALEEKKKRKEKERLLAEQREKKERIEIERKRLENANALASMQEHFQKDFLKADLFYEEQYSEVVSRDEYEVEKIRFVQAWVSKQVKKEPDSQQSAAIASYGKHTQVIARAGSGKTTTLVNRAIFLQKHCNVSPGQIILLAFNRKAAEEIKERLEKHFGDRIPHVMTFHALAYATVHPEEALLYDDATNNSHAKSRSLQSVIDDFLRDSRFKEKIRSLMLEHFRADWEKIVRGGYDLEKKELVEYRRSLPNVSLRGEYLKSYGEKLIADFLFEHDIPYKYERNYWWKGVNYRPDFTIFLSEESGLIIEYFGLRGDLDYDELTERKREYWKQTRSWELLEVIPSDVSVGRDHFFTIFKLMLEENGVSCSPLTEEQIWNKIKERAIDRFTTTAVGFIQRCRKLSLTRSQLTDLIDSHHDLSALEEQFLEIAAPLYSGYLARLKATGEEDFDGLMQRAAISIREGQSIFERKSGQGDLRDIRYMFIDEYQDFSDLFLRLIEAIRSQNSQIEFFCVGDDWQAINGFAGSDLQFYENFQHYFSPSRELYVSKNYRSSKSIVALGNALMEGLGKPADPHKEENGTILLGSLWDFIPSDREKERHNGDEITPAVLRLVSKLLATDKDVVLLSRKNTLPWYVNYTSTQSRQTNGLDRYCDLVRSYFPEELRDRISTSTAHKYKGLQNEAVIVVDAVHRSYPLIHPDWIFTRVLGDDIGKIISEERRLFYVAITRAVDTLIILTDSQQTRSPFLEEIMTKQSLRYFDWKQFPPIKDENSRLTVRVGNLNRDNQGATYAIKDQLKASGYRWDSKNGVWQKSFLEEAFSPEFLKESVWSPLANEICVRIVDDRESVVDEYSIHSGQWSPLRKEA